MIITLFLIPFTIILISIFHQFYKFRNIRNIPRLSGIQNLLLLNKLRDNKKTLSVLSKIAENCGTVVKVMAHPWDLWLIISDPDANEFFLQSPKFVEKPQTYTFMYPWVGSGILTAETEKWQKLRKLITPVFHFKLMEERLAIFNAAGDIFVECLLKEVDKRSSDIYPYVAAFTLDTIIGTAMGVNINAQNGSKNDYMNAIHVMSKIAIKRTFNLWMRNEFLFKLSHDYIEQEKALKIINETADTLIKKRRKWLLEKQNTGSPTCKSDNVSDNKEKKNIYYLDIFLEGTINGKPVEDKLIRHFINEGIFAGFDTSALAISYMIYALANNLDVQNKVVEELKSIFGNDKNRPITVRDINDMKYIELVIKEVLRFYPPIPFIARAVKEDAEYKGSALPKGLLLIFNIYGMHKSPELFDDPDIFNPDRFLSPEDIKSHSFMPFSAGPRSCMGQKFAMYEIKVTFAKLLRNFEFLSVGPEFKPQLIPELVLKSENGVRVHVKHRDF